jgi:hypothetical protein
MAYKKRVGSITLGYMTKTIYMTTLMNGLITNITFSIPRGNMDSVPVGSILKKLMELTSNIQIYADRNSGWYYEEDVWRFRITLDDDVIRTLDKKLKDGYTFRYREYNIIKDKFKYRKGEKDMDIKLEEAVEKMVADCL